MIQINRRKRKLYFNSIHGFSRVLLKYLDFWLLCTTCWGVVIFMICLIQLSQGNTTLSTVNCLQLWSAFWDVPPCNLADRYQNVGKTCWLYHHKNESSRFLRNVCTVYNIAHHYVSEDRNKLWAFTTETIPNLAPLEMTLDKLTENIVGHWKWCTLVST
jgi:hypothetical protein